MENKEANSTARIDWLSMTFHIGDGFRDIDAVNNVVEILNQCHVEMGLNGVLIEPNEGFCKAFNHKPYSWGISPNSANGIVLMGSSYRKEVLVDFQGVFCANNPQLTLEYAKYFREIITRIDIACDTNTSMTPIEAIEGHNLETTSVMKSEKGTTCYLGSPKSEYYARVYKYNPPHIRSNLLRTEIVYRRDYAKKIASMLSLGVTAVDIIAGYWQSKKLKKIEDIAVFAGIDAIPTKVKVERAKVNKDLEARLYWLKRQVNPALIKMITGGVSKEDLLEALPALKYINI